jgi:hypothetical protein
MTLEVRPPLPPVEALSVETIKKKTSDLMRLLK